MAIQYPDFRADPNAVPQIRGLPTFIESLQKGYQLAQLPEQMRSERAMRQQQLQAAAQENYYRPLTNEANLAQSAAATQGQQLQNQFYPELTRKQMDEIAARTGLTNTQAQILPQTAASENALRAQQAALYGTQNKAAQIDLQQAQDFRDLMAGAGQPQQAPQVGQSQQPSYTPGQANAPYMQPQGNPPTAMQPTQPQQSDRFASLGTMTAPGNESVYRLDEIALNHPELAAKLKAAGHEVKITNDYDKTRGIAVTTTTLPSGRTFVNASKVIDTETPEIIRPGEQESYKTHQKDYDEARVQAEGLQELANTINSPAFAGSTGPFSQVLSGLGFSSDQAEEAFTKFNSNATKLQAAMASSYSSRGTNAALNMAARAKPDKKDTVPMAIGKMEALNVGNKWMLDYKAAVLRNMQNHMTSLDAQEKASKDVPIGKYRGEMEMFLNEGQAANSIYKQNERLPESQQIKVIYVPKDGNELPYVADVDKNGNRLLVKASDYAKHMGLK